MCVKMFGILMVLISKVRQIIFDINLHILGHANDPGCPAGSGRDYNGKFIANLTWHAKKKLRRKNYKKVAVAATRRRHLANIS